MSDTYWIATDDITITDAAAIEIDEMGDMITDAYSGTTVAWTSIIADNDVTISDPDSVISWKQPEIFLGEITIPRDLNCENGQYLAIVDKTMTCADIPTTTIIELYDKEANMWTSTNILIVAIICLIVVKFVAPRLTLLNGLRWFVRFIQKPFKKAEKDVGDTWKEAKSLEDD